MNPSTREETFMRGISNVLQGEDSGVSIAPSSRTEYFLNEILEAASGGGGGGGGDSLNVVFSWQTNKYVCDKTCSEVEAAIGAKTPVSATLITQYGIQHSLTRIGAAQGGGYAFSNCYVWVDTEDTGDTNITYTDVILSENNSVSVTSNTVAIGG